MAQIYPVLLMVNLMAGTGNDEIYHRRLLPQTCFIN
jgi:hypothetical protein